MRKISRKPTAVATTATIRMPMRLVSPGAARESRLSLTLRGPQRYKLVPRRTDLPHGAGDFAPERACSSAGRALESHSRGHRFDPGQVQYFSSSLARGYIRPGGPGG